MSKVINLTDKMFKEKIFDWEKNMAWTFKGDKPAIIDFYAVWCNPCKMLAPIMDELSIENDDIDFYKVNIEEEGELASMFDIKSIPSILFIPIDEQPELLVGGLHKPDFERLIKEILKK